MPAAELTDAQRAALDAGRQAAPPAPTGNGRALKHGGHSTVQLQPRAQELADGLRSQVPGYEPRHEPLLTLLALNLARLESVETWLAEKGGYLDAKGKPRPPVVLMSTWGAEARRLLTALGMDNTRPSPGGGLDLARLLSGLVPNGDAEEAAS